MGYWTVLQWFNFLLAFCSGILFVIVSIFFALWTWDLRKSNNPLVSIFPVVLGFKLNLAFWAFGNAWAMYVDHNFPPNSTMLQRILFAILVLLLLKAVRNYYVWRQQFK